MKALEEAMQKPTTSPSTSEAQKTTSAESELKATILHKASIFKLTKLMDRHDVIVGSDPHDPTSSHPVYAILVVRGQKAGIWANGNTIEDMVVVVKGESADDKPTALDMLLRAVREKIHSATTGRAEEHRA